jgi:hypothetical protein
MNEELWAGAELKLEYAQFHFNDMARLVAIPQRSAWDVAVLTSGAIIDNGWQRFFYAHLDALLSAARSVPEIIQCCFGHDQARQMKTWFVGLSADEQRRRRKFSKEFKVSYDGFRALPLGNARHISQHRTGVAPVEVRVTGRFGVTYIGGPAKTIPTSEARPLVDPNFPPSSRNQEVRPTWSDFTIQGQPLFETCREYLNRAQELVEAARRISDDVHGTNVLTAPPDSVRSRPSV